MNRPTWIYRSVDRPQIDISSKYCRKDMQNPNSSRIGDRTDDDADWQLEILLEEQAAARRLAIENATLRKVIESLRSS